MTSTISKSLPKILCLHGYGQNSTIFAKKTGYLRPYLKNQLEFVYVNAPNPLDDDHQFVVQMKELLKEYGKSNGN
jgi:predicted esterase